MILGCGSLRWKANVFLSFVSITSLCLKCDISELVFRPGLRHTSVNAATMEGYLHSIFEPHP